MPSREIQEVRAWHLVGYSSRTGWTRCNSREKGLGDRKTESNSEGERESESETEKHIQGKHVRKRCTENAERRRENGGQA